MSQENVEVVPRLNRAFNERDLEGALALFDPAAVWRSRADEPDTGDYDGREAIREMAEVWRGCSTTSVCSWTSSLTPGINTWSRRARYRAGVEEAVQRSDSPMRGSSACAMEPSPKWSSSLTGPKLSKLWGCGSRRCRRRTWLLAFRAAPRGTRAGQRRAAPSAVLKSRYLRDLAGTTRALCGEIALVG
jgi:SnoaL-like domain